MAKMAFQLEPQNAKASPTTEINTTENETLLPVRGRFPQEVCISARPEYRNVPPIYDPLTGVEAVFGSRAAHPVGHQETATNTPQRNAVAEAVGKEFNNMTTFRVEGAIIWCCRIYTSSCTATFGKHSQTRIGSFARDLSPAQEAATMRSKTSLGQKYPKVMCAELNGLLLKNMVKKPLADSLLKVFAEIDLSASWRCRSYQQEKSVQLQDLCKWRQLPSGCA